MGTSTERAIAKYILDKFDENNTWEQIMDLDHVPMDYRSNFFSNMHVYNGWPILDKQQWEEKVEKVRLEKEKEELLDDFSGGAMLVDEDPNNWEHSKGEQSAWQKYIEKLIGKGFNEKAIENLNDSTLKTLRQLKRNQIKENPVKGMVIGNVQSGKTANMAGLMATAADNGFNFFVVLTGSIENLRAQTESRLSDDLNEGESTIVWDFLEQLKKTNSKKLSKLHIFDLNNQKSPYKSAYVYVCLKNSKRLSDFLNWLDTNDPRQGNLRILVIDDEADQAGINTKKLKPNSAEAKERTKINQLICNLVFGKNSKGKKMNRPYQAVNYVGYTATPYANVLNEAGEDSLYPSSFIQIQQVSDEYFGPQQIFGIEQGLFSPDLDLPEYDGMDIIRDIPKDELAIIKKIHDGKLRNDDPANLPDNLKKALLWFMCSVAALRVRGYHKPLSFLIHTSANTDAHDNIWQLIEAWLDHEFEDPGQFIEQCRKIYEEETSRFSIEAFKRDCFWYGSLDRVADYPVFQDIEEELRELISEKVQHIQYFHDGSLKYSNGIHLCVDNSKKNGKDLSDSHLRLVYPQKEEMPEKAPAFIVVGGMTLSRGLTIEGLVSSYFLRSTKMADSLMQMGRWFGYRKGYELFPRIWLPEATQNDFLFLSSLDYELRKEIHRMEEHHLSPKEYGPRILTQSAASGTQMETTARNKRQSAVTTAPLYKDYWGFKPQAVKYFKDDEVMQENESNLKKFLEALPKPVKIQAALVWKQIPLKQIMSFISQYKTPDDQFNLARLEDLETWIEENAEQYPQLKNWDVVLAGISKGNPWEVGNYTINMPTRRRHDRGKSILNIKALVDPKDYLLNIPANKMAELDEKIRNFKQKKYTSVSGISGTHELRKEAGIGMTPVMVIYVIDKNSSRGESDPKALNTTENLVGISFAIPENPSGEKGMQIKAQYQMIPLEELFEKNDRTDV